MHEIAKILISFGMDFEYVNQGSNGERITCDQLMLDIQNIQGEVTLDQPGKTITCDEENISSVLEELEKICIKATN